MVLTECRKLLFNSSGFVLRTANFTSISSRKSKRCLLNRSGKATYLALITRSFASKQESYFSAIGGESDEPPPDLTAEQVTTILRTHEKSITNLSSLVKRIDCNQLASNHPIEDRLRIATIKDCDGSNDTDTIAFAVFDGHGGGLCADVVSRRLYHYIAVALASDPKKLIESKEIEDIVNDIFACPDPKSNKTGLYDDRTYHKLREFVNGCEKQHLIRYAEKLAENPITDVSEKLKDAFKQCDTDLADEIEHNLLKPSPKLIHHFYYSLAVSGSCATLLLLHRNMVYVANTGDCKAVVGMKTIDGDNRPVVKAHNLSIEHNSDNLNELKRLFAAHPQQEQNNIVRNNRLLGQLMPLRAFGDFGYKWPVERIKRVGLVRAFGPHVIPPYYFTPPYLICEPEIEVYSLDDVKKSKGAYVVISTDGLWEQFETARHVVKQAFAHEQNDKKFPGNEKITAAEVFATIDDAALDRNLATHMLRCALGQNPSLVDPHLDAEEQKRQEHKRLVTFLTLPASVVRNFRDDISIIILQLN